MNAKGIFSHPVAHQIEKISAELVRYDGATWIEFNFVDRQGQTGQFVVHATSAIQDGLTEWAEATNTIFTPAEIAKPAVALVPRSA